ncbi:MAG: rubrerythrin [Bacillota bacterium]
MDQIKITTYDRLMRAWENSQELTRDFEMYSKRIEEEEIKQVFKKFAEDECRHVSKLRSIIDNYKDKLKD